MKVELKGIKTLEAPEDRGLLYLSVEYNGKVYDWNLFIPSSEIGNIQGFIDKSLDLIQFEIDEKEEQWNNMEKTYTVQDPLTMEEMVVEISKEEIVKPDFPDYYMKRRMEYPTIGEQLDAIWTGVGSEKFQAMQTKINNVKTTNSKPIDRLNQKNQKGK